MKGKHFAKAYWSRTRIVSAILSVALLFGCITFTSAWLIAEDKEDAPMVNEFTGSQLEISLTPDGTAGTYKLVPGVTYNLTNDAPIITVEKGSVECYLFVVVHETDLIRESLPGIVPYYGSSLDSYVWDYFTIPYGLEEVDDCTRSTVIVPYNDELGLGIVAANPTENQSFQALNSITVRDNITKARAHPDYFVTGGGSQPVPKISIDAYSIQTLGFKGKNGSDVADVKAAWEVVKAAIESNNTKEVVLD